MCLPATINDLTGELRESLMSQCCATMTALLTEPLTAARQLQQRTQVRFDRFGDITSINNYTGWAADLCLESVRN